MKIRVGELTVSTSIPRTLAWNAKNRGGRAEEIIAVCRQSVCDVVGQQQGRQDGNNGFTAAGYVVDCSGAGRDATDAKRQRGVGLAIKGSILLNVKRDGLAAEFIGARLVKVQQTFKGNSNEKSFVLAYAPAERHEPARN